MDFELKLIILQAAEIFFRALELLVIVRVLLSWLAPRTPRNQLTEFIWSTTEPILSFFRKLPLRIGLFDLSPIVALLALHFLRNLVVSLLG